MAKKSSRRAQATKAAQQESPVVDATSKGVNFAEEYHYVIRDLRNMGMLALVMLVVLVGLSFIIR